ncbi:hypothetical protein L226DRAFT_573923 [Lentinus tigrinus ALCF2SS1-7]|uniref:Uncharacterized protein n=1 Tax=Lentinus tigrinus ALCF2SS1-6 TaxID=1328759 RepID=A0A5C2RZA3_9APHY|nr:hypothetical protein L227DRAFT_614560 [Lentinus tigrinus ALCF2SS1-6]RPD71443.1 hypothetical protein L226DRAFT_573923 [Lentinus tigrinus ALCF2SS1-7]
MSSQTHQSDNAHLQVPLSSEPHGISCTIVAPTPPVSPNLVSTFPGAQTASMSSAAKSLSNGKSQGKK